MMFQGLRTVIYRIPAENIKQATDWYAKVLGKAPYFEESFYVGFNVGGFELGLDPSEGKVIRGDNIQAYWGVQNIQETLSLCLKLGATTDSEIREVGGNIKVATVRDPFGNLLGLIENPNFKIET